MIRFNIIGHGFLDVAETGGIAFKTENQHFRFAEVSLGRSVEFSVPATDYNRKMLAFGEDPVEVGEMLRVVHPCQMIYDGGQKMGTLAVTAYEGDTFKCVFTIGNAEWIEKVQNLKLSDVGFDFVKGLSWSQLSTPTDANLADPTQGALIVRYENGLGGGSWQLLPSVNVKQYLIELFTALGVPFSSSIDANYWLVTCSMKGGLEEYVTIAATGTNAASVTPSNGYIDVEDVTIEWATNNIFGAYVGGGSTAAKGFRALKDLSMTFPAIVPSDLFLIKWDSRLGRCEEIGGHFWWTNDLQLDGKTIELKKDDIVFFASKGFYARGNEQYYGWKDTYYPLSLAVTLNETEDMQLGDNWYMRNNHPDMTVFEFLKSVALATGLELTVDGENGVTLDAATYGVSSMKDLKNVVSIDTVTRRVQSWGNDTHDAVVGFDSEDYVTDFIRSGYSIENEQLQAETEHKAKFSEGNVGTNGILVRDVDDSSGTPKLVAKKWTICYADPNEAYLQRIATPSPVGYDDLAANSTAMRVKCAMPLAEFFKLDPSTTWVFRGAAYLWSDADWSDGMLSMTLQRVSQPAKASYSPTPPPPPKPYDSEIEYLESSGTQWIDTGLKPQNNETITIDMTRMGGSYQKFYIGSKETSGKRFFIGQHNSLYFAGIGYYADIASVDTSRHIFTIDTNGTATMDNGAPIVVGTFVQNNFNMYLFACNNNGSANSMSTIRVHEVTIGARMHLIPVRVGSVGYMYDTVNGTLFGNDGTGDFILGPDV